MRGGVQATPLVVDGIMYLTGPWSTVYSLDARTGELLWQYDPDVPRLQGLKLCCGMVNRGAALYEGKVYVGTLDARLIALDKETGGPENGGSLAAEEPPGIPLSTIRNLTCCMSGLGTGLPGTG
jgi:outer membrane protein assembly factor BamB